METRNILERNGRRSGMTVPDGYFVEFAEKMAASLPPQPFEREAEEPRKRSTWQILRPYVYMAAMFMGVWLMMTMFNQIRPSNVDMSIESNPTLAAALSNDAFMEDYFYDDLDDSDIMTLTMGGEHEDTAM